MGRARRACWALQLVAALLASGYGAGALGQPAEPSTGATAAMAPSGESAYEDAGAGGVETQEQPPNPTLRESLKALGDARLLSTTPGSIEELRALLSEGDRLHIAGRDDEAAILLLEAVESPRFADFEGLPERQAAELTLAAALDRMGSRLTARRYLERIIARGPEQAVYGPAVRRFTDVALALGDPGRAASILEPFEAQMPEDARAELAYLRARAHYDAGELDATTEALAAIGKKSRFHANARYLSGAIAARQKRFDDAEAHFCAVTEGGAKDRFSFYVDQRYFDVRDLAWLGLGRVAHERRRADDAFYYYFQVPQDSERLAEAFFEAAYASYEGGENDTAIDLLDQLETRFPDSPFVDEATILRGYVSLARCDFDRADRLFERFEKRFGPLKAEIGRMLRSPARRERLYEELLDRERGEAERNRRRRTLLSLLSVDPEFYRLHAEIASLDAEAARAGRLSQALDVLAARLSGSERPRAAEASAGPLDELATMQDQARDGREGVLALSRQLDAVRRAGGPGKELHALERELSALSRRIERLDDRIADARMELHGATHVALEGEVDAVVARDVERTAALPARAQAVRRKLVTAANARALSALRGLEERLGKWLGRARIGRIDAIMGSKRRIEIQIQSLAAGRFPAELRDPLLVQGFLDDDEEYWPFEGEDWPDEYVERYGEGQGQP